jgi:hypothetical protein
MGFKNTSLPEKVGKIKKVRSVVELPEDNTWLPVSIIAYHFGVSTQTIRNLFRTGQIRAFQFPVGPTLFSAEEVELASNDSRLTKTAGK